MTNKNNVSLFKLKRIINPVVRLFINTHYINIIETVDPGKCYRIGQWRNLKDLNFFFSLFAIKASDWKLE